MTRPRCSCPLPWVRALYQCPHGTWHTPVTFHDPDTGETWPGYDHADTVPDIPTPEQP